MFKNPLKEITNKRRELLLETIAPPHYPSWCGTRPHRDRLRPSGALHTKLVHTKRFWIFWKVVNIYPKIGAYLKN